MTITNEQAAYIAGLFDGEGSIYFAKRPEKKKKHKGGSNLQGVAATLP